MKSRKMRSFTAWHRLSPTSRNPSMKRGRRAELHDPLWLLGRQWQVGEFAGEDGGSPVKVELWLEHDSISRFQAVPEDGSTSPRPYDPHGDGPLEAVVEREPVTHDPAQSATEPPNREVAAEAGRYFLALLDEASSVDAPTASELAEAASSGDALLLGDPEGRVDAAGERYLDVMRGRSLDGHALYTRLTDGGNVAQASDWQSVNWGSVDVPHPGSGGPPDPYKRAAKDFVDWYRDLYDDPEASDEEAWVADRMEYEFRVSAGSPETETVFDVDEYPGGRLDRESFSVLRNDQATLYQGRGSQQPAPLGGKASTGARPQVRQAPVPDLAGSDRGPPPDHAVVPTSVTFPGMPSPRWWEFEDGDVNLADMTVGPGELGKLLLSEFAILYGNDWFALNLDVPVGSLTRITQFLVTDTFGQVDTVEPAGEIDRDRGRYKADGDLLKGAPVRVGGPSYVGGSSPVDGSPLVGGQTPVGAPSGAGAPSSPQPARGEEAREGPLGGVTGEARPWNLFMHRDLPNHDQPGLLIPPVLAAHHQSDPVEKVTLARDEMANMAFAVEQVTEDAVGDPLEWDEYDPPDLAVAEVHSASDPADEWIRLENAGGRSLDLTGWTVQNAQGDAFTFGNPGQGSTPPVVLAAGEAVTLHSGRGTRQAGHVYWGRTAGDGPVWSQAGDVEVLDGDGDTVLKRPVAGEEEIELPRYRLVTDLPENWFPMRMQAAGEAADADADWEVGDLRYELSLLVDDDTAPRPAGEILEDAIRLHDEELPRAGLEAKRSYQYARWIGGSTHLWSGRRIGPGRGEAASGLRYDWLEEPGE